jgi:ankyrin repeat protein
LKGGEPVVEATQSEPPTVKAPDISIHEAASLEGNIEAVKQHLAAGANVNEKSRSNMPTFFDVIFDVLTEKPLLGAIFATFLISRC